MVPGHDPPTSEATAAPPPSRALVVIAASAGGVAALSTVLATLPADFPVPIAIVQHRTTAAPSLLAEILQRRTTLAVKDAEIGDVMRPGTIYLAAPDLHLVVRPDLTLGMMDGQRIRGALSSANPLFQSASNALGAGVVAVVLSGSGFDATDGVQAVKAEGGVVIAQHPETAQFPSMPLSAIKTGEVDHVVPLDEIAPTLLRLVGHAGT